MSFCSDGTEMREVWTATRGGEAQGIDAQRCDRGNEPSALELLSLSAS